MTARPHVVILDLTLQDGFCARLGKELQAQDVPFVIFSGYRRDCIYGEELMHVPWIEKPGTLDDILTGIAAVLHETRTDRPLRLVPTPALFTQAL